MHFANLKIIGQLSPPIASNLINGRKLVSIWMPLSVSFASNWLIIYESKFINHKHALLLFSDTPFIPEFSKFGTTMSIWTDYHRINNTHFKSKSLNTIIGMYEDRSLNSERFHQKCKQSWNRRWWGPSSIFQAYLVVLSDLRGKLRRGYNLCLQTLGPKNFSVSAIRMVLNQFVSPIRNYEHHMAAGCICQRERINPFVLLILVLMFLISSAIVVIVANISSPLELWKILTLEITW